MHIYISGIGGSGMSSLAQIALDLNFQVSGSDLEKNSNCLNLEKKDVKITYQQTAQEFQSIDKNHKIDWFLHSASIKSNHPEFKAAKKLNKKISKREEFINFIVKENQLKLIAISGTHGKTTCTAMLIWVFKQLDIPISFLVGTNLSWEKSGKFDPKSQFFVLEADEYDRSFLKYKPEFALITSVDYDHPDIYPTRQDYQQAFLDFIKNSNNFLSYQEDLNLLKLKEVNSENALKSPSIGTLNKLQPLIGHNKQNAFLVAKLAEIINLADLEKILKIVSTYPGSQRRMEKVIHNLYTDYAHHPVEIKSTIESALELNSEVIVIYEPHQNFRQKIFKDEYRNVFDKAKKVYWLPTYLVRENKEVFMSVSEVTASLNPDLVQEVKKDQELINKIKQHLTQNQLVIVMGAGPVDAWLKENFS